MYEQNLVLISIIYQLIDNKGNINKLNPYVKQYVEALQNEFNFENPEELTKYKEVYFYADTFFNATNQQKRLN